MKVKFHEVSKSYDTTPILNSLTAEIPPRTLLAITGVNGVGKTTLLNILSGITGTNKGWVEFDNIKFHRDNVQQRKKLCYLSDFNNLFPENSLLENIAIHLKLWQSDTQGIDQKVIKWLEEFDMLEHANSHVGTLSRGQYYKAAFIALMAVDPELWLIDEPFASGMDPQGITMFRKYARERVETGGSVIYTTQLLDLAEKFSTRIWVLDHGELQLNCTAQELTEHGNLEELFSKLRDQQTTL